MMFRTTLTLVTLFITTSSVFAEQSTEKTAPVNFTDHILPIFRQHCLKCHNANDAEAGLAIDSYGGLMEGGGSGDVVVAGDPSASRLYLVMTHDEEPTMPPNQEPIAAESLALIKKWIEGGILENSGSKAKKRKGPSLTFSSGDGGKPDQIIMPETLWRVPVVTTQRAAAATALAASPWAPLVAVAGQRQVSMYHTDTNELVGIIPYPEGIPQVLRFSPDGGYLLVAGGAHSSRGTASLYDVRSGQQMLKVGDELDIVFGADINDQLTRVAMGGPQRLVRIFDTSTGEGVFELKKHTDWVYCVDYSPDGVLVASGDRSGGLHVWEADTGRLYLDLIGHKGAIRGLAWRSDSNVLVSASEDGTVKIWEMNAGNQLKSFNAHGGGVTGVAMAKDGRIVTSGKDKTVKLWNADGGAVATMPAFEEPALEVAITHDGLKIVGGDWNGRTTIWQIADPKQATNLAANPPALEAQQASFAATVAELEKSLSTVTADFTNRQKEVETSSQAETALVAKLDEVKNALAKSNKDKAAADNLLAEIQKQKVAKDQELAAAKAQVAGLEQKKTQYGSELATLKKQMADAVARVDQAKKDKQAIAKSLESVAAEHAKLRTDSVAAWSALMERELDLLTQVETSSAAEAKAEAERSKSETSLAEIKTKIQTLAETIKSTTKQAQEASAASKAAAETLTALTAQLNTSKQQVAARNGELEAVRKQLEQTQDEAQKKSIAEQVAAKQAELDAAKQNQAGVEGKIAESNQVKSTQEQILKDSEQKLAAANGETAKLKLSQDQVTKALAALTADRDRSKKEKANQLAQLQQLRAEIAVAMKTKEAAVKKLAEMVATQSDLTNKGKQVDQLLAADESFLVTNQGKVGEFEKSITEVDALLGTAKTGMNSIASVQADLVNKLKNQPQVIAELVAKIKTQSEQMPKIEQQLVEAKKKTEESKATMATAKTVVDTAALELNQAKTKLAGIQSELVAFQSQAAKLQDELNAAQAAAAEKRSAVEPESINVAKLTESMTARDEQLAKVSEALKKLEAELETLKTAQTSEKAKLDESRTRLQKLEEVAEEAEVTAQETEEKVEFFKSAYGA